jgi:uncharacterized protein
MRLHLPVALAVAVSLAGARARAGDAPLTGTWSGTVSIPGQELGIVVAFTAGGGTLDVPAQGAHGIPLARVTVQGTAVSFDVPVIGASFKGTIARGEITGTMTQRGQGFPFHLAPGATPGYTPPPPPPRPLTDHAGRRLLGDWTGTIQAPSGPLATAVRFEARNGLVVGTADDLAHCAPDLPITQIILTFDRVHVTVEPKGSPVAYADGRLSGDTITGTFHQGGAALPFTLTRVDPAAAARATADRPYAETDVTIPSTSGVALAGTLTLPAHAATPPPVVVLVTGSGPQDRDECVLGVRPFRQLADHLARHGIATLRYDDRGTAKSTGDFATATAADFADDADAAVAWLAARTDVDVHHVGVLGHSEGGLIAPMVAVRDKRVAFIVLWAGPGVPLDQVIVQQVGDIGRAEGAKPDEVAREVALEKAAFRAMHRARTEDELRAALKKRVVASLSKAELAKIGDLDAVLAAKTKQLWTPWFRWYLRYDPARTLARVKVPVLAVNGGMDKQVDARTNLAAIRRALARGHDRDVKLVTLPGLNHLFQQTRTGAVSEYARNPPALDPSVLDITTTWIRAHAGLTQP